MGDRRYGDIVRDRMASHSNAQGHPITIRMLERATGYTYEHLRKVVKNLPVVSRELNDALSEFLGLHPEKMWSIAQAEKLARKFSTAARRYSPPPDARFKKLWPQLTPADVDKLRKIAERMAEDNEAAGLTKAGSKPDE